MEQTPGSEGGSREDHEVDIYVSDANTLPDFFPLGDDVRKLPGWAAVLIALFLCAGMCGICRVCALLIH